VIRHGARGLTAPYKIPHVRVAAHAYYTNTTPCGPFRAPGAAQAVWAMESHVDEIARDLGMDPLEFRLKNLVASGDSYVDGGLLEDICYPTMLRTAADSIGWAQPRKVLPSGERVGRGLAVVMKTTSTPSTSSATVKLNDDGSLDVLTSSVEMGQGASTVLAQIAAERSGVDVSKVHISQVDTDSTPYDQSTSSSRTTFAMGRAISDAVEEVNVQLRDLAGKHLEADPADIELGGGVARVRGVPDRSVEYGALVRAARRGNLLGGAVYTSTAKPDPTTGKPGVSAHYHQAVGAAEVAVDPDTGRVRVLRLHAAVFAGRAINPTLCELQTEGSAFFGLGQALFEAIQQEGGQISNANLGDYLIPSLLDAPRATRASIHEEPGHEEVHGIGEVAAPVAPPAIANAVADAVGVRVRDLPITPEQVLRLCHSRETP
jgi:CO/xanthine dehydrogenase Mo-binding subunit